jgi:hypothetical protein
MLRCGITASPRYPSSRDLFILSALFCEGVVFMVGANFILLGSTKVVAILAIYADLLLGLPARLLGSALSAAADKVSLTTSQLRVAQTSTWLPWRFPQ